MSPVVNRFQLKQNIVNNVRIDFRTGRHPAGDGMNAKASMNF
jgi:hypothetical protein